MYFWRKSDLDRKRDVRWHGQCRDREGLCNVLVIEECGEKVCKIFYRVMQANHWEPIDRLFRIDRLEWSQSEHIFEYLRLAG